MTEHDIKQVDVAKIFGISLSNINKKIRRKVGFRASEIKKLHDQLGIAYEVLLG